MPKKLIVANWKMNPQSQKEAEVIFKSVAHLSKGLKRASVVVCPPYPYLFIPKKLSLKGFILGSQNISHESEGPYTGEVSAKMQAGFGVTYTLVGHSERRVMGESDALSNKKVALALKAKFIPILCVGESVRDVNGFYLAFIKHQLHECLAGISKVHMKNLVIAYEPLWAIGKDASREATPEEFIEMRIFIRKVLSDMYDAKTAHAVPVLYGGSVHPENADAFLTTGEADGLLVGRDSLTPKKFGAIIGAVK